MKNIKDLKPTNICIRATEENAEFIVSLLEELGGEWLHGDDRKIPNVMDYIGSYYFIASGSFIAWGNKGETIVINRTEITLSQLREMAGEKEPKEENYFDKPDNRDIELTALRKENEEAKKHLGILVAFMDGIRDGKEDELGFSIEEEQCVANAKLFLYKSKSLLK